MSEPKNVGLSLRTDAYGHPSSEFAIAWDAPDHTGGSPITNYQVTISSPATRRGLNLGLDNSRPERVAFNTTDRDATYVSAYMVYEGNFYRTYTVAVRAENSTGLGPPSTAVQIETPCPLTWWAAGDSFSSGTGAGNQEGDCRGSLVDVYVRGVENHLSDRGRLYVIGYPSIVAPTVEWSCCKRVGVGART